MQWIVLVVGDEEAGQHAGQHGGQHVKTCKQEESAGTSDTKVLDPASLQPAKLKLQQRRLFAATQKPKMS